MYLNRLVVNKVQIRGDKRFTSIPKDTRLLVSAEFGHFVHLADWRSGR